MLLITSTANIKLEKEITGYMVVYPRWRGELIYSKPSECIRAVYPRWRGPRYRLQPWIFSGLSPLAREL